jgi:hypothetical protein
MDTPCEQSSTGVPALGNTASGAVQLSVRCDGKTDNGNSYGYIVDDWQDLENLLKDTNLLGFAFPMKSGQFKVVRFSLSGGTDAMSTAESIAAQEYAANRDRSPSTSKRNTSDTTL